MKRRKAAIIFTVLFVFSILLFNAFVLAEADHDCSDHGEECAICRVMTVVENCIKGLKEAGGAAIVAVALATATALYTLTVKEASEFSTLVSLKVKLSA